MAKSSTSWQKGGPSPNPGGRPKALHDLQELARSHTVEAVQTLVKIMRNDDHPQQGWAAEKLLDRAWGKPMQPTVQTNIEGSFEDWLNNIDAAKREITNGESLNGEDDHDSEYNDTGRRPQ